MLREKPAKEEAVIRLIDFLKALRFQSTGTPGIIDVNAIQESYTVAKRSYVDCRRLGFIKVEGEKTIWLKGEATRKMALEILDFRLKKSKKTIHVPINADWAAIANELKTISERLALIAVQNEKAAKTPKNGLNGNCETELFKVDDQRLYLAGQIAGNYFKDGPYSDIGIDEGIDYVVKITDVLLSKLLNKK